MKKILISLLAATLYICSIGVSYAGITVSIGLYTGTSGNPNFTRVFTGTIDLMDGEKVIASAPIERKDITIAKKTGEKSCVIFENIEAGTYTLRPNNMEGDDFFFYTLTGSNASITVGTTDFGKNVKPSSTGMKALITVVYRDTVITKKESPDAEGNPQYDTVISLLPVRAATVLAGVKGEGKTTKTTDEKGQVPERYTIMNNVFFEFNVSAQGFSALDTTLLKSTWDKSSFIFALEKIPVYSGETVKVSGTASIDGQAVRQLPDGLKIGITSAGVPLECEVTDGQYEFAAVPRGEATFKIMEGTSEAYEYRIKTPAEALTLGDQAEVTQNIDIEHFAATVSCSFTGTGLPENYWAYADLVNTDDETVVTQNFNMTTGCKFRGVLPGTYMINIRGNLGYGAETAPEAFTVTRGQDVVIPTITLVPDRTDLTFRPLPNKEDSALYGYNKYLDRIVYMDGARLELWNETKDQKLDASMISVDDFALRTQGVIGEKFIVKIFREDILDAETTVTTTAGINYYSFKGLIKFKPVAIQALNLKGVWNDEANAVSLTWEWPGKEQMENLAIAKIELRRRIRANNEWTSVTTWENPDMNALPVGYDDHQAANGNYYIYEFSIHYTTPEEVKRTTFDADARFRYKLNYSSNNDKMGTITGQQPGDYVDGSPIELTASPNKNYEFAAWMSGGNTVAETATILFNISQDTNLTAVFEARKFKIRVLSDNADWGSVSGEGSFEFGTEVTVTASPEKGYKFVTWNENSAEVSKEVAYRFTVEKDRTLVAVFEENTANEDLEAHTWSIRSENGTLMVNGLDGDLYTVYDLNGRMMHQTRCSGAEIRLAVTPNQLYIVRRVSAQGTFGFKKIVVR